MECGKASALNLFNYAGLDVQKDGNHAFPHRIKKLILPGNRDNQFFCADCANKRTVQCSVHGQIKNSKFEMSKIPNCIQCEEQLKAILDKKLPSGFKSLLFPVNIVRKAQKNVPNGIVTISDDGYVHIIDGKVRCSINEKDISTSISNLNSRATLHFNLNDFAITICEINVDDPKLFQHSTGPWIDFWKNDINNKLNMSDIHGGSYTSILDIEFQSISTKSKGFLKNKSGKYALSYKENQINTFPVLDLLPIENFISWHTDSFYPDKSIKLKFMEDNAIQILKLKQKQFIHGLDEIEDLKKILPSEKINDHPEEYDLSQIEFADAIIYPERERITCKVETKDNSLVVKQLNNGRVLKSSTGIFYRNFWLINSINKETFTIQLSRTDKIAHNILQQPKEVFEIGENQFFCTFFDKEDASLIREIYLDENKIIIDETECLPYANIQQINVTNLHDCISQLMIKYTSGNGKKNLKAVSTDTLCFKIWELIETYKINSETALMDTNRLYKKYNKTKKKSLLTNIFKDIIVLNSNINKDIAANELSDKLSKITDETFFSNKKLREITTRKMLLLSVFIPKIKQNFSLLESYFPYYKIESEISFLNEIFGANVAKNMLHSERKRIRTLTRNNIRMITSNVLSKLNQIQQELHPLEQKFAKEEIQNALSTKVAKNTPLVGQIILAGVMLGTVGIAGVGIFGGMIGIKALGDILGYYAKDRESAIQLRRVAERVLSWWRIFIDTLPVTIYEAGEAIDDENNLTIERDKAIFSKCNENQKPFFEKRLQTKLRKEIERGKSNQFKEILEGSGIRYQSIETDIESSIQIEIQDNIRGFIQSLPVCLDHQ
jgi:hypothetical protein